MVRKAGLCQASCWVDLRKRRGEYRGRGLPQRRLSVDGTLSDSLLIKGDMGRTGKREGQGSLLW